MKFKLKLLSLGLAGLKRGSVEYLQTEDIA